jgi:transposase
VVTSPAARRHPPPEAPDPPVVAVPGTPALTDAAWARVVPLLPANARRGKRWRDHRRVLGGILWVMPTGAPWREVPEAFGPWQTVHSRYRRWRRDGTWARVVRCLQASGADGTVRERPPAPAGAGSGA